jgi:RNA polymerase sigma factor (sigma-70 family)
MRKVELKRLEKNWMPLVVHVMLKHFSWAIMDSGTGAYQKIRRAVDPGDLKQVGFLALVDAYNNFDKKHHSNSSFKTYAYRVIYNSMLNYLDDNCTPITTSRRRQILKQGSEFVKTQLEAATQYTTFSEISSARRSSDMDELEYVPSAARDDVSTHDPRVLLEDSEFHQHCMDKIKAGLESEEYRALILRYSGKTFDQIGETLGISYELVRSILESLNYKLRYLLQKEIEEFGHGSNTDKSISHQA